MITPEVVSDKNKQKILKNAFSVASDTSIVVSLVGYLYSSSIRSLGKPIIRLCDVLILNCMILCGAFTEVD